MISLVKTQEGGFIFCLPLELKVNIATITKLQCQLKVSQEPIILHLHPAREFLHSRKCTIVDDNGDIVTVLDPDIDKKFVISERDINLYFALNNESMLDDENIFVEVIPYSIGKYRT